MNETTSPETLNAYVDGELDAEAAARVMEAAARDPEIARRISMLMKMKAAVAADVDVPPITLNASPRPCRGLRRLAMAASVVLTIAAGAVAFTFTGTDDASGIAGAADAHRAWTAQIGRGAGPVAADGVDLPELAAWQAYVPDLRAARLQIAHVGQKTGPAGEKVLVVGYLGSRGCKVTLAVSRAFDQPGADPQSVTVDGLAGYAWRLGEHGYVVLAEGMSAARLRGIARGIWEGTRRRLPLSDETQTALQNDRASTPPCRA